MFTNCNIDNAYTMYICTSNLFLNDLVLSIKATDKGVTIDDIKVCILLYADDIVLIAETEMICSLC